MEPSFGVVGSLVGPGTAPPAVATGLRHGESRAPLPAAAGPRPSPVPQFPFPLCPVQRLTAGLAFSSLPTLRPPVFPNQMRGCAGWPSCSGAGDGAEPAALSTLALPAALRARAPREQAFGRHAAVAGDGSTGPGKEGR